VPAALGLLRAIVVIPCRMLTSLSPEEVEALLLHELAHIRRHDYFVNLLQTALETLLFYHPAVWWVSKVIRTEREHCCDDLVVGTLHNPFVFARALASLEDQRRLMPELAMSAQGGFLVNRIRRILGIAEPTTKFVPAWPSIIALGSVTLALTATVGAQVLHSKTKPVVKKHAHHARSKSAMPIPAVARAPKALIGPARAIALPPAALASVPPRPTTPGLAPAIALPSPAGVPSAALAPVAAPPVPARGKTVLIAPTLPPSPARAGGLPPAAISAPTVPATSARGGGLPPAAIDAPTRAPKGSVPVLSRVPILNKLFTPPAPTVTTPPLYASTQPSPVTPTQPEDERSEYVSIDTSNMTFAQAIADVFHQTGSSYVIEPGTFPAVQLNMRHRMYEDVLKALCFAANATFRMEGGVYYIVHKTEEADSGSDELNFKNTSFHEALQSLAKRYHISITAEPDHYPAVNLSLSHAGPVGALDALCIATGTTYRQEGSLYVFTNKK